MASGDGEGYAARIEDGQNGEHARSIGADASPIPITGRSHWSHEFLGVRLTST